MPHLTLQITPLGPLIDVYIGVSAPRDAALKKAGAPVPQAVMARLLIDTGASGTAVDPTILAPLGLSPTGIMTVHTPTTQQGAPVQLNQFDVSLLIPTKTLTRTFHALSIGECNIKHQGIDGLLGRDVLAECMLIYTGPDNAVLLSI